MAGISKCPKCEGTYFEVKENSPSGSNYKLMFVQCSKCGSVLGSMDYFNIGTKLSVLEEKVENLEKNNKKLMNVFQNLNLINDNIIKLFNLINSKIK